MSLVSWVGLALVAVSAVGVLACAVIVVLPAGLRLRRVALVTTVLVEDYRAAIDQGLWTEREHALERAALLRPLRRIRRVLSHPLVVALAESYARRRARARSGLS